MNRMKAQVDAEVECILSGRKSSKEKLFQGFLIAKLYYDIKEVEKAKEFILGFLTIQPNHALAHKLLGQIYELTGVNHVEALDSFKRSLELDTNQKDVILKICEILCKSNDSAEELKFWAEKAERHFSSSEVVLRLKLKAMKLLGEKTDGKNDSEEVLNKNKTNKKEIRTTHGLERLEAQIRSLSMSANENHKFIIGEIKKLMGEMTVLGDKLAQFEFRDFSKSRPPCLCQSHSSSFSNSDFSFQKQKSNFATSASKPIQSNSIHSVTKGISSVKNDAANRPYATSSTTFSAQSSISLAKTKSAGNGTNVITGFARPSGGVPTSSTTFSAQSSISLAKTKSAGNGTNVVTGFARPSGGVPFAFRTPILTSAGVSNKMNFGANNVKTSIASKISQLPQSQGSLQLNLKSESTLTASSGPSTAGGLTFSKGFVSSSILNTGSCSSTFGTSAPTTSSSTNVVAGFAKSENKVSGSSAGMSLSFGTPTFTFAGISNKLNTSSTFTLLSKPSFPAFQSSVIPSSATSASTMVTTSVSDATQYIFGSCSKLVDFAMVSSLGGTFNKAAASQTSDTTQNIFGSCSKLVDFAMVSSLGGVFNKASSNMFGFGSMSGGTTSASIASSSSTFSFSNVTPTMIAQQIPCYPASFNLSAAATSQTSGATQQKFINIDRSLSASRGR